MQLSADLIRRKEQIGSASISDKSTIIMITNKAGVKSFSQLFADLIRRKGQIGSA